MSRVPHIEAELIRVFSDVSGLPVAEFTSEATFADQGLDSLVLTQASLEIERVFGLKLRFRRMLEDLDTVTRLAALLDRELPADRFAHTPVPVPEPLVVTAAPAAAKMLVREVQGYSFVHQIIQLQIQLMSQQLALLSGNPALVVAPSASIANGGSEPPLIKSPLDKPLGAVPRPIPQSGEAAFADSVQRNMEPPYDTIDRKPPPVCYAGQDATHDRVDFAMPTNATEQAIAAIWIRLLNVAQVGRNDNFFNLGGHSLLALRAVHEIQRITGEKIAVSRMIFESLGQIATSISTHPVKAAPGISILANEVHAESDAASGLSRSLAITPVRFGQPVPSLYGVFHPSGLRNARPHAVLFCNPFGQEAVRIHRFFGVLAHRLARAGVACLRFDYHASGESLGDDCEADLDRWVQDVVAADALLRQNAGVHEVDWVAPRLASALAVRASAQAPQRPRQLVLWEPVVSGARYVDHLLEVHASVVADLPDGGVLTGDEEILGFGVSRRLLEQMRAVVPADYQLARTRRVTLVASHQRATDADEWVAALQRRGVAVQRETLSLDFDWTSEEAFNTALVPTAALNLLEAVLKGDQLE